ncbi:MAG: type II toxin-antitoxin system VapC family toxin [Acidobacteria bacterium]|nr:type II toxin-antitoxin system VapC family toxin [Acidobacteriota bacterium]MBI3421596.1 type II toxin-antitoxin system VapC family toxin [Acidobacteriota bacterium]
MSGILFDTSVYISALRQGDAAILGLRRAVRTGDRQTRPLWLSVVVLEELYVGAVDAKVRWDLQRMEREFLQIGRLLVPDRRDWTSAGQVLAKVGQKYGFNLVGRARLTNDALIAMSVASHGFTVQTKNPGDFQLLAEFRPFDSEIV